MSAKKKTTHTHTHTHTHSSSSSFIVTMSLIQWTACVHAQFSWCSSTTNAHSETGQMAVCCQNLTLGALSSRCALSVLVGALFKKLSLFLNMPRMVRLCNQWWRTCSDWDKQDHLNCDCENHTTWLLFCHPASHQACVRARARAHTHHAITGTVTYVEDTVLIRSTQTTACSTIFAWFHICVHLQHA